MQARDRRDNTRMITGFFAGHSLVAMCVIVSCAGGGSSPQPDAGATRAPDADLPPCPDYLPDRCGDECVSFKNDPDHCGNCGHICGTIFSDRECVDHECRCGANAMECASPSVCFSGQCVVADLGGASCDLVESQTCADPQKDCIYSPLMDKSFCTRVNCSQEICNGLDEIASHFAGAKNVI